MIRKKLLISMEDFLDMDGIPYIHDVFQTLLP